MEKLPWSTDEYKPLEPGDLEAEVPPTPEQRVRVAAALATIIRDRIMLGTYSGAPNFETIRGILTMTEREWARDIGQLNGHVTHYDAADPLDRFHETALALSQDRRDLQ